MILLHSHNPLNTTISSNSGKSNSSIPVTGRHRAVMKGKEAQGQRRVSHQNPC
jgi:hypothetical protein